MKKGTEPMFPTEETITTGQESYSYTDIDGSIKTGTNTMFGTAKYLGMSKRLFIATMAMQGVLSNAYWIGSEKSINYEGTTKIAFKMADALLEIENQESLDKWNKRSANKTE